MERYSATTGKLATLNSNMMAKLRLPGSPSSVAKLLMQVRNRYRMERKTVLHLAFRVGGSLAAADMCGATRWLSWYGVGLASADRLPVVVRIPAGPLGSLKCDPPKGNGR